MRIDVPGEAKGKGRPRFGGGRAYTDTPTLRAEQRIADAWRNEGCPRAPDVPLNITVVIAQDRPKNHMRVNGDLTAEGQRHRVPVRKPDLDNALKLIMDSLNGLAYRDDVQFVTATVSRRWTRPGENARTTIWITENHGT